MCHKKKDGLSNALWIPLIWMFLAGSRTVGQWLNLSPSSMMEAYHEGSPIDAVVFSLLIGGGLFVLSRRKIGWGLFLTQNKWVCLYFLYCVISITWCEYPFLVFKKWTKELGVLIMVLVILTDRRPFKAIGGILKRLAILWLPLSIVLFKYYPALGRGYTISSGVQFATGVTTGKNELGKLCLICGIYFSWKFLLNRKKGFKWEWKENITDFLLMGMIVWLLHFAQSATSFFCLMLAVSLFFMSRRTVILQKPDRLITLLMVVAALFLVLDTTVDARNIIIEFLGRDKNLTNRVYMWDALKGMAVNPIIGTGYQSFWLGERLEILWEITAPGINQAHNGYLEQYLNLGYIGVFFIGAIILSGVIKIRRRLHVDYPLAMLRLCIVVTVIIYNYTEASFYGLNNMWLLLLFAVIEIPEDKNSMDVTQQ